MRARKSWTRRLPGTLTIDINIYGQFEHGPRVGKILASNQTYLQQPLHGIENVRYYNPQFLHIEEFRAKTVSETPRHYMKEEAPRPTGKEEGPGDEQRETDDTKQIHSILDSLSHRKILTREYTTDRRMKTKLLQSVLPTPITAS